jgi:hypothetical protein
LGFVQSSMDTSLYSSIGMVTTLPIFFFTWMILS